MISRPGASKKQVLCKKTPSLETCASKIYVLWKKNNDSDALGFKNAMFMKENLWFGSLEVQKNRFYARKPMFLKPRASKMQVLCKKTNIFEAQSFKKTSFVQENRWFSGLAG